ncbi:tyrosine-type recombinase/integrase [Halorarum salinum]|uniref:Site-specific integrase n=1 Tax=Halorarum salinum TaxID=2743089 RepID=A0A7D5QII6_9EURY|nr:tyrosine-type recombinase/integrase [Halobaculum salinum]QLG63064.1 site-specific integrase [Halobaculum salinum]
MTRNSHQDAISEAQFDRLMKAARDMPSPYSEECEFILITAGRLGMRAGELCHLTPEWLNTERSLIEVPRHDPCTKGKHGEICGYCAKQAASAAEHDEDKTILDAMEQRWEPKTDHAVRAIPYDFDEALAERLEELVDDGGYRRSRVSVNRRVDRVVEAAGMDSAGIYPHALRATASTFHACRGLPPSALQSFMGWADLSVANKYVRLSGEQTARALRETHS